MALKIKKGAEPAVAIDMTPMIDTLLQLFVVFLLSMSFAASSVPPSLLPPERAPTARPALLTTA